MVPAPFGMSILPGDDRAPAGQDAEVEPRRLEPPWIVDEAHLSVASGYRLDDRPRTVGRAAVGDDDLVSFGRIVLLQDRLEARLDVARFVEHGNDHADKGEIGDWCVTHRGP